MTPEEIVATISAGNRAMLYLRKDYRNLMHEQVLALMDAAAMQGFRLGSDVAMSMAKGALLVQLARTKGRRTNKSDV